MGDKIKLGMEVEDIITGFKGIASGKAKYITGCTQFSVSPKADEKGDLKEGIWFDKGRLKVVGVGISGEIESKDTGGPMRDAPKMRR